MHTNTRIIGVIIVPILPKWFYYIFIGVAIGAAHFGYFAGKAFSSFGCTSRMNAVDTMIYVV
jgi:hypothetical protein